GADMLTIHGRTRDKMYSGEVNFKEIVSAKQAVQIPVIANGGVFCNADAEKLISETGADGIMVARGAMYNPFVFAEITATPVPDKKAVIKKQLSDTFAAYDNRFAVVYMRKMLAFYIKGQPNAAATRVKLMAADCKEAIEDILENICF
ncbi:MAG: tRNA-dihydrouridine synthase, partial [Clostridia bacterium]|nr:tRNA-dihydrouridine synthase [Clostridia bacterium]